MHIQSTPRCQASCPAGFWCPIATAEPIVCSNGTYCPRGSQAELDCPPGTYGGRPLLTQESDCITCAPGTQCPARSSAEVPCSPGTHAPGNGSALCQTCSASNAQTPKHPEAARPLVGVRSTEDPMGLWRSISRYAAARPGPTRTKPGRRAARVRAVPRSIPCRAPLPPPRRPPPPKNLPSEG